MEKREREREREKNGNSNSERASETQTFENEESIFISIFKCHTYNEKKEKTTTKRKKCVNEIHLPHDACCLTQQENWENSKTHTYTHSGLNFRGSNLLLAKQKVARCQQMA